jgi:glycosyltransferase involved in cell wall biosynthesis
MNTVSEHPTTPLHHSSFTSRTTPLHPAPLLHSHTPNSRSSRRFRVRLDGPMRARRSPTISHVQILGIRGLPPAHGGFETFVGRLAPFLVQRGHRVTVYCQLEPGEVEGPSTWNGVDLVYIRSAHGSRGSISFDLRSTWRAARHDGVVLVFGYNTGVFNIILSAFRRRYAVNMDGIEWKRRKWGRLAKAWFWLNERVTIAIAPMLIADHPAIERHLRSAGARRAIEMIPYGGDAVDEAGSPRFPDSLSDIDDGGAAYATIIARPEPENSILEMVSAFSRRPRDARLVVLGRYSPDEEYQASVLAAASDEVLFPGPIYERETVAALRARGAFYMYGHTVGGTSPTLVEALAAGTTPLCLDTVYSRWVAGDAGVFFADEDDCDREIERLLSESDDDRARRRAMSLDRFAQDFTWDTVLGAYQRVVEELSNDRVR